MHGHALFDTDIGTCAIAWGPAGVVGVQLPEANGEATRVRLLRHCTPHSPLSMPVAPPSSVQAAISSIQALLAGQPRDLREIVLDMAGISPFHCRVYELARTIAPGHTRTYGDLAADLGDKALARAVGQAMGLNPFAPVVPCHRVLAAGGRPGGFSAAGGALTKLRMLAIEGVALGGTLPLFGPM